jgi:hypothetical protein
VTPRQTLTLHRPSTTAAGAGPFVRSQRLLVFDDPGPRTGD